MVHLIGTRICCITWHRVCWALFYGRVITTWSTSTSTNPFIRRWVLYCLLWYSSLWWWKKYSFTCGANVDDHEKKLSFLVSCSFGNTKGMNWSKTAISDYCANVYKQADDGFGKDTFSIFCHTMGNFNQKNEHLYRMQTSLFRKITVCPCYDNVLLYNNV